MALLPVPPLPGADTGWALFLDVDGTLLGFADNPGDVQVPEGLAATLSALHDALGGALTLVSGRRLEDLDRLFGGRIRAAAGLHGLQRRRDDDSRDDLLPDPATLAELHRRVDALAAALPGVRVEDKNACIALHYRETPALEQATLTGARHIAAALPDFEVQPGNHVVELKPAGMDKGKAIEAFLGEAPFAGRTPIYIGDDLTDEHAFAAVNVRGGISIRVGDRVPSAARFTLHNPAAVQTWLNAILARFAHMQPATP